MLACICICQNVAWSQHPIGAIGTWREHYNNHTIHQIIKGDKWYAAATNQIIAITNDKELEYIGKSDGLHDIGIHQIAWDSVEQQLIIVYRSGNIDIKKGDQVYLIPEIKTTNLYNQKQMNAVYLKSPLAFVKTGFGVVVIDLQKHEIKESWLHQDSSSMYHTYPYFRNLSTQAIPFKMDSNKGIALFPDSTNWIDLKGPHQNIHGSISFQNQTLIAPFGNQQKGFAFYDELGWHNESKETTPIIQFSSAANTNNSFWLANANALYHFNKDNASIETTNLAAGNGNILAIAQSPNLNEWIIDNQNGLQLLKDGKSTILGKPPQLNLVENTKILANRKEQVWLAIPNQQGLYIYQSNEKYATAGWIQKTTVPNNGNLPSNNISCLLEDRSGQIWVGTDNGIGIFQCNDLLTEPCNAYLPLVQQDGFNAYLFQKEKIKCMAVDGANRKWVGTDNGIWLLSEDGIEIIEHFSAANSPLPSDTILQILVEPNNGEVFILTHKELVSYRGTATEGKIQQGNVLIYPNPVPPNFNGIISIKNLVEKAMVKITDLNGKLIYQTRSLGGQAIWHGKTYEGNKVATGMYLVFVQDNTGQEKAIGKILISKGN